MAALAAPQFTTNIDDKFLRDEEDEGLRSESMSESEHDQMSVDVEATNSSPHEEQQTEVTNSSDVSDEKMRELKDSLTIMLLRKFGEKNFILTLAELEALTTSEGVSIMVLPVGWSALLRVASDRSRQMDPWFLRDEFHLLETVGRTDEEVMTDFRTKNQLYWATTHQKMSGEELENWQSDYTTHQTKVVEDQIRHRLGIYTSSNVDVAAMEEARKIGHKVLDIVNGGGTNPFALDEIRNMIARGAGVDGRFEMGQIKEILDGMAANLDNTYAMGKFRSVLDAL